MEIFCEDCKLAAPLAFFRALGLVFVYIDSSPLGLQRIHNHSFHDHTTSPVERTS